MRIPRDISADILSAAFDQADHVLYDMLDPLMEVFRSSETDFYNQYVSSRVIQDL